LEVPPCQRHTADLDSPERRMISLVAQPSAVAIAACQFAANAAFADSSYRIVRSDLKHPDSFVPVGRLDLARFATAQASEQCKRLALKG
jgi:hypothetical protein